MQRIISDEDNVDKANRHLQNDLAFERDRNEQAKRKIKEAEVFKNELIRDIRKIEGLQDEDALQHQGYVNELSKKINNIQEIEKEHYFT